MNRVTSLMIMGAIVVSSVFNQACTKDDHLTDSNESVSTTNKSNSKKAFLECELTDIHTTDYSDLFQPYFSVVNGTLTNYYACENPLQPTGDCCNGGAIIYLDPGPGGGTVFEYWGSGAGNNYDPLSDGVLSVQEQLDLVSRAEQFAIANPPFCGGGSLNLQSIEFYASPSLSVPGDIVIHARATYYSVCLMPG